MLPMTRATPPKRTLLIGVFVGTLLAAYGWMAISASRDQSTTFDETFHLTGGYSYWRAHDFRLHPENGNMAQRWAALPLCALPLTFPSLDQPAWYRANHFEIGHQFFYEGGNNVEEMLLLGRGFITIFGMLLGLLVFLWSRELFGVAGGFFSLLLYIFCPDMLAHGALATSDMTVSLFFTLACWRWWRLLQRVNLFNLAGSALAFAALCLAKMSWVIVVPVAGILLIMRILNPAPLPLDFGQPGLISGRWRQVAVVALVIGLHVIVVAGAIWWAYDFRYSTFRSNVPAHNGYFLPWDEILKNAGPLTPVIAMARAHHILPEAFLYGFSHTVCDSHQRCAFMHGAHSIVGWPGFFPYCLLIKTPPSLFLALALAAVAWLMNARSSREHNLRSRAIADGLYRAAPLWVFLAVYWSIAITSHLNIGHRHILPTYPYMYILAGGAVHICAKRRRLVAILLAGTVTAQAITSLQVRPHYLAYFSPFAGGPAQGYRHLVDSSLDWGQDLPGLKRWLDRECPAGKDRPRVYLSFFGSASPDYYGIDATRLPGYFDYWHPVDLGPLTGGVYCVSATMLQKVYPPYMGNWVKAYERDYWAWVNVIRELDLTENDPEARRLFMSIQGDNDPDSMRKEHAQMRFARLCAYLRQREPDAEIGYSILIYRLTDTQVQAALFGPPAERLPMGRIRGVPPF